MVLLLVVQRLFTPIFKHDMNSKFQTFLTCTTGSYAWINNRNQYFMWGVIAHPRHNPDGGLANLRKYKDPLTEMELSFLRKFNHWLHRKFSF